MALVLIGGQRLTARRRLHRRDLIHLRCRSWPCEPVLMASTASRAGYARIMSNDAPMFLDLRFASERPASPTDAADVLQSLDDMYRLVELLHSGRLRFPSVTPDLIREVMNTRVMVGHGDSPLTIESFRYGSPFDVVAAIPWDFVAGAGGVGALAALLTQIERLWNMPKRICVESKRLDAEAIEHEAARWRALAEAANAEHAYWSQRRSDSGRHLQGVPEDPAFTGVEGTLRDLDPPEAEDA